MESATSSASASRAIVASDVPGCREIVHDGINGLLVPVKNVEALADAIRALVKDKSRRETMGANGRKMVEKEFALEVINRQTMELYSDALEQYIDSTS